MQLLYTFGATTMLWPFKKYYIMAIVNSLGIGRSKKSAGNLTYRTVRGRCIASQKVSKTGPITGTISQAQAFMSMMSLFMQAHSADINVSFNKSAYGSQRNFFMRLNKSGMLAALSGLALDYQRTGMRPSLNRIDTAVKEYAEAHPDEIYRVYLSGFQPVFLAGEWTSDDNPISGGGINDLGKGEASLSVGGSDYKAPCATSLNFAAGAKIVRGAGDVSITCNGLPAGVAKENIKFLTNGGAEVGSLVVSNVVSSSVGRIVYTSPAIEADDNVVGVSVGGVFVRLTSAYVVVGGEGGSPL